MNWQGKFRGSNHQNPKDIPVYCTRYRSTHHRQDMRRKKRCSLEVSQAAMLDWHKRDCWGRDKNRRNQNHKCRTWKHKYRDNNPHYPNCISPYCRVKGSRNTHRYQKLISQSICHQERRTEHKTYNRR
jgi:hypothetical protein